MKETKNRLGRGLDSLLGSQAPPAVEEVLRIDIEKILPGKDQPRRIFSSEELEELAQSVMRHGLLQPILVRPDEGGYRIIAGERRWRAAQKARLHQIPAIVREPDKKEAALWPLLENIQREDLNPIEKAKAFKKNSGRSRP